MRLPTNSLSRRQWLASSGAAGLVGTFAIGKTRAAGAFDDNSLIRVGLVGCGGRGTGAAEQTLSVPGSNVRLVAMADAFEARLEGSLRTLAQNVPDKLDVPPDRRFVGLDGYKKVLDHCDLVILATPPGFRPYQFEAAVQAGKHIFMEKPLCVDAHGARLCLEAAKQADAKGLKVVVGLQRHYQDSYLESLKRLRDGMIGEVVSASVHWNGNGIWYRDRQPGMTEMQFQVHNWYHFCWLSGDHICEQHVHNIDVANWFLDALPATATGFGGRQVRIPGKSSEIYDHHTVEFRYPNGVVVTSTCRQFPGVQKVTEEFRGTKGVLTPGRITDLKGNVVWQHQGAAQERGAGRRRGGNNPYQVEHNVLHASIRSGEKRNDAYFGTTSSFTAVLGRYATYTGKVWTWDEAWNLADRSMPETLTWDSTPPTLPDADGNYKLPMPGTTRVG